jgi:hypothetical protein
MRSYDEARAVGTFGHTLVRKDESRLHVALIRDVNDRAPVTSRDVIVALQHRHEINLNALVFTFKCVPELGPYEFGANKRDNGKRGRAKFQNQECSVTSNHLGTASVLSSAREALSPKENL